MKKLMYIGCSVTYISLVIFFLYTIYNIESNWQDTVFKICFTLSIVLFVPYLAFCECALDRKISKIFVILLSILGCAAIVFLLLAIVIGRIYYFFKDALYVFPAATIFSMVYSLSIIILWLIPAFTKSEKVKTIALRVMTYLIFTFISVMTIISNTDIILTVFTVVTSLLIAVFVTLMTRV